MGFYGLFQLIAPGVNPPQGELKIENEGGDLEEGTAAEVMEAYCSVACLLLMAYLTGFLIPTRISCLWMAPPTVGWSLQHRLLIKKKTTTQDLIEAFFSVEVSLLR